MKKLWFVLVAVIVALLIIGLVVLLGPNPEFLAWSVPFFDGYSPEQLVAFVLVAALFVFPQFGVTFLNFLKEVSGLNDDGAHKFVVSMLTLIFVLVLLITGYYKLDGLELTLGNLMAFVGEAYLLSQITYKKFFKK